MARTKLVKNLKESKYPEDSPNYPYAHKVADQKEKAKYPKGYEKLKKAERKLPTKGLLGKNTKAGKIEVNSKYKKNEKEITLHEVTERNELKKLAKRKHK